MHLFGRNKRYCCTAGSTGRGSRDDHVRHGRTGPDRRPRTSRDALLKDEITGRTETDAFALLSATRPSWLRVRGASSMYRPEMIQVYVNGMRAGSIQSLRSIQANTIVRAEHLDGARATERFGADHGAGAILLTTM